MNARRRVREALARTGLLTPALAIWRRRRPSPPKVTLDQWATIHTAEAAAEWQAALGKPEGRIVASADSIAAFFASFSVIEPGVDLIRVGGDADGGYLIPDDLSGIEACLSPGVDTVATFERDMVARGIPCHLIDASVDGPPFDDPLVTFRPLFLGAEDKPGWTTLATWVRDVGVAGDLLLQMDIEGHEWVTLLTTPREVLQRFRILVIEMHDAHLLATVLGNSVMSLAFERLLADFELVHVHANNYLGPVEVSGFRLHPAIETTWLRRDRVVTAQPRRSLIHSLDRPCRPGADDPALDPRWA